MATSGDLARAEDRVLSAVQRAFSEYLQFVGDTVFSDPSAPDWVVWPEGRWYALVEQQVVPVAADVARRQGLEEGLSGQQLESFVDTFVTRTQTLFLNQHIPGRVLQEATQKTQSKEYEQDPDGVVAELLVASSPLWVPMLAVFAANIAAAAVNEAVFAAAAAAEATVLPGRRVQKTWNAVLDDRTRFTHRVANRQTVDVGDTFFVGGFPLRFPHDPFGPPQETINCRCVLSFKVV